MFDFNEEGKLTLRELEFLIDCSMLSIFKIFDVKVDVNRDDIASFIYNNFSEGTEITCKRLLTWCSKSSEFQRFFKVLKKELPKPIESIKNSTIKFEPLPLEQTTIQILEEKLKKKKKDKPNCRYCCNFSATLSDDPAVVAKYHLAKQDWSLNFSRHLNYSISSQHSITRLQVKPNWVFGINSHEVMKSFCYHNE